VRRRSKPLPRALQALSHAKLKHLAKPQVSLRECLQREGGKPCTPERCAGRVRPSAWPHPVARAVAAFSDALRSDVQTRTCRPSATAPQERARSALQHSSQSENRGVLPGPVALSGCLNRPQRGDVSASPTRPAPTASAKPQRAMEQGPRVSTELYLAYPSCFFGPIQGSDQHY